MKQYLRNTLSLFTSLLWVSSAFTQTVTNVDGIRYLIEGNNAIVGRQDKELSGDIVIPASITYNGTIYQVTGMVAPTNITAWSSNTVTTEGGAFQSCRITSISLPTSITTIAAGAFNGCSNLSSVSLPSNLVSIGAASFAGCNQLQTLEIPETVESFGSNSAYGFISYTFGGCTKLKNLNIPNKISTITNGCFKGCGLDSIYIPQSVRSLGEESFATNTLRIVKMGVANLNQLSYTQTTFSNVENIDLYVPKGSLTLYQEYEPWSNFKSIQEYGEEGETFTPDQINITTNGIKYILKNSQATIGRQNKDLSGDIIIPEYVTFNNQEYPVTGMVAPTDLVCYSGNSISCTGGAFQGSKITSIVLPQSIKIIAAGAFQNCAQLEKVVLPESIIQLSAACFAGCYNLYEINIPEGITDLASNTAYGYRSYVFGGCSKIKNFNIPNGVTRLASGCFQSSGLEYITIPAQCLILDEGSLNVNSLKEVKLCVRDMNQLTYTESVFGNVSKTSLLVPHGSKQVYQEYYPWMNFKEINEFDDGKEVFIPSILTVRIDDIRYVLDNNSNASVGRQNKDLSGDIVIPESVVYNNKEYIVNKIVAPTDVTAWSSNTVSTENGAFQSCPITSISIPQTITMIPAGAFYGCSNLREVKLSEGLKQLGAACFAGCRSIEELQIPNSVTDFGSYTAYGFKSYIFGNCSSLKKVNIPTGITKFTEGCFKGCGLEIFIIPSTVKTLQEDCFNVSGLKALKITHSELNKLNYTESIFSNVSNVTLYVPEGTSKLYNQFYPWKNFKEIVEYKDQNDEYLFNAYSVTYVVSTPDSNASNAKARLKATSSTAQHDIFAKQYNASGITIEDITIPEKEGFVFKGWTNIPSIMPSKDIVVEAVFEAATGINEIKVAEKESSIMYDLSGRKVNSPRKGLYIIDSKKIIVK